MNSPKPRNATPPCRKTVLRRPAEKPRDATSPYWRNALRLQAGRRRIRPNARTDARTQRQKFSWKRNSVAAHGQDGGCMKMTVVGQLVHKIFRKPRENTDTTDRSTLPANAVGNEYERKAHSSLLMIVSYTPFALHFCPQRCRSRHISWITCVLQTVTVIKRCYVNMQIKVS